MKRKLNDKTGKSLNTNNTVKHLNVDWSYKTQQDPHNQEAGSNGALVNVLSHGYFYSDGKITLVLTSPH